MPSLETALSRGPVVLDGGLSNQLEAAGHDLSDELWTARLLRDDPAALVDAHLAYFAAGASVVLTASYQASFPGFARHGISAEETAELLRRSVSLAKTARDAGPDRPLWIAASVGPYGASLADGSEYRGRYGLSAARLREFHLPRLAVLAEAGPDLFAVETIPDVEEAAVLVAIAAELDVPLWLSYTVAGTSTRAGQPLGEAFALAAGVPQVIATGINCSAPEDVPAAVALAAAATGKPVVVYPNSGEVWDAAARRWTGRASWAPADVRSWVDAGARLIGGCCRVGPEGIAGLAATVATP
ncbi:homocysteine S-methyltransferase [Amycolatopsis sp. MtRt-6]|uniref:homocysteine S-methyltransferase n=1 Tax=Amycolatopsis sp. MtRt-6 TaxID=2792782 RepID=UPI0027DBE0A4|nr:homocysteine S-methyltransferase [Amycolatopsis sp. MtRt-6]